MTLQKDSKALGHAMALVTAVIWGCTFVSSKVLLESFTPIEVMFFRFVLAYIALWIMKPKLLRTGSIKRELGFAAAGLTGVTLYFVCENVALTYTQASNVGVIVSVAPMFTAVLSSIFFKSEKPGHKFYVGFLISIAGIALISFNGAAVLKLSPMGDALTVAAALSWAVYSLIMIRLNGYGYGTLLCTRRVFFYGLVFMTPLLFVMESGFDPGRFASVPVVLNFLFLGLVASALCYVFWNRAFEILGAVKTNVYIYLVPVVSIVASAVIIREKITWISALGAVLTLMGLWFSQISPRKLPESSRQEGVYENEEIPCDYTEPGSFDDAGLQDQQRK